ncbi:MAG: DUF2188 domain-containing protein [Bacteroidota bacterium]
MPNVYHVVPRDESWAIKLEGRDQDVLTTEARADAIREADALIRAQGAGRVVIHKETGAIESVHTFDTLPPEPSATWVDAVLERPVLVVGVSAALIGIGLALASRR